MMIQKHGVVSTRLIGCSEDERRKTIQMEQWSIEYFRSGAQWLRNLSREVQSDSVPVNFIRYLAFQQKKYCLGIVVLAIVYLRTVSLHKPKQCKK